MRLVRITILALIVGILLPIPSLALDATLTIHFTNNGVPLADPDHGKFFVYEPGKREEYVGWGRADATVRVPEGPYDLVVRYENDTIREDRVIEKVNLLGEMEHEFAFTVPVAQLNVFVNNGGEPAARGTARYSVHKAGRRGKPLASRRPGIPVMLRRGSYDIEVAFRDLEGLQRRWLEGVYVEDAREESVEIGSSAARLSITAMLGDRALPEGSARWRVFRPGDREDALAEARTGESLMLEPGRYDVGIFFDHAGSSGQRWLVGLDVVGSVRKQVDVSSETTSLAVWIRRDGALLTGAWFSVFPEGSRGTPLVSAGNGAEVRLDPGSYDIRCNYHREGVRAEQWFTGKKASGQSEVSVEMEVAAASLRVRPASRGGRGENGTSPNILLLVDSSGEMAASLGVRGRLEQVARMTGEALSSLSGSGVDVGLRVFGIVPRSRRECEDSTLLTPVQPVNPRSISSSLKLLRPSGYSPIAHSLAEAANDLPAGDRNALVLITGSVESCEGKPCAEAAKLLRSGAVSRIYVVALGIGFEERNELDCIGDYRSVAGGAELRDALREILREVRRGGPGVVNLFESGGGNWVAGGSLGERIDVNPGRYDVVIRTNGETYTWTETELSGSVEAVAGARPPR